MDEPADIVSDEFWQIIADAKNEPRVLAGILEDLSSDEMRHFYTEFQWVSSQLQDARFIEFVAVEEVGDEEDVSEDAIEDIADWVVSQGKTYYSDVWNNPELITRYREEIHAAHIGGVAPQLYWARFQEPLELDGDLCDEYDGMV